MKEPRIYVDLNEMVDHDVVLLSQGDYKDDSSGQTIHLKEGMVVKIYMDDTNDFGEEDNLIGEGTVELNTFPYDWCKIAKWCCRIDAKGMYNESEVIG